MQLPVHVTALACAVLFAFSLRAEKLPQASGETLSGRQISLPDLFKGRDSLLCIGFSRGSQAEVKQWDSQSRKQFAGNSKIAIYSVAVLEGAPRLIRGMIVRSIKGSMPASRHDTFLVLYQGQTDLKRVTAFNKEDEAYVLLLDQTGEIKWRAHGGSTLALLTTLSEQVLALKNQ